MLSIHLFINFFLSHSCSILLEHYNSRLIELLEQLRTKAGKPIHVNCGYRCPSHNAEVGGVPNSQHMLGTAADITIPEIGFERARELVESIDFDGTAVSAQTSNGGIDICGKLLFRPQLPPFGNSVAVSCDDVTIAAFTEDGKRISRTIKLEETPPCLSVAIDDLLKLIADEQKIST